MKTVKNIIFDLGGVLLNLDISRTDAAFAALAGDWQAHRKNYQSIVESKLFERFETNAIREKEFLEAIRAYNPLPVHDNQICVAWSAMLMDLPKERLDFLRQLRDSGYNIYLLSNTNSLHLKDFYAIVEREHGIDFDALFHKTYYSHLIEQRKPLPETYEYVLQDAGLSAAETLFIDDNYFNIEGAKSAGLQTILHQANSDTVAVLKEYLGV